MAGFADRRRPRLASRLRVLLKLFEGHLYNYEESLSYRPAHAGCGGSDVNRP